MAHYDLEEQEQIDSLKTWWKLYGNLVTTLVTAASLLAIGWQGWQWYSNNQSTKAAAVYAVFEQALDAGDAQRVKATVGELSEQFSGTHYAAAAALLAAQSSFASGDLKSAQLQLTWVVNHASDEFKDIARLRLASLLLDEKSFAEAESLLNMPVAAAFQGRQKELLGDLFVAQGKAAEAKIAYGAALDKVSEKSAPVRELLQQKIDALGGAA